MEKTLNPLEVIVQWITRQPTDVRSTIYFMVGLRLIDRERVDDIDFVLAPETFFNQWVDTKQAQRPDDIVAAVLQLRSLIQFFIIEHFGFKAIWEFNVRNTESIADEFRAIAPDAKLVADLDQNVRSAPFRQKLWERVVSEWEGLVEEALTNKHLKLWQISQEPA